MASKQMKKAGMVVVGLGLSYLFYKKTKLGKRIVKKVKSKF